jgi:hypothetical protein
MTDIICDAPASFTKMKDGSWGLRIQGTAKAGQSIAVQKRDGGSKTVEIGRVVWTGNGISLATISGSGSTQRATARPARASRYSADRAPGGRKCSYCGARDCAKAWDPRDLCDQD